MTSSEMDALRDMGRQLRAARRKRDIPIQELALHLGVPVRLMYRLERYGATGMWARSNWGPRGAAVLAAIARVQRWVSSL